MEHNERPPRRGQRRGFGHRARPRVVQIATIAATLAVLGTLASVASQGPLPLVITNVRILDPADGRTRPAHAVVIEGAVIAAVHESPPASLPDPATRVDGRGATLVPALADLSVQAMPGLELDTDFFYALSLAHGVMRLRTVGVPLPWAVEQRDRMNRGGGLAPRLWTAGPRLDMRTASGLPDRPVLAGRLHPSIRVADAAGAATEAAAQVRRRVDWVTLGEQVPAEVVRRVVAATRDSTTRVSLQPGATPMAQAARLGVALLDGLGPPVQPAGTEAVPAPRGAQAVPGVAGNTADSPSNAMALFASSWTSLAPRERQAVVTALARQRVAIAPMLLAGAAAELGSSQFREDLGYLPERLRARVEGEEKSGTPGRPPSRAGTRVGPQPARPQAGPTATRQRQAGADPGQAAGAGVVVPGSVREFLRAVVGAGGRLVVASGASATGWPVPGVAVHRELALLVEAGLTPVEAIRAATVGAADLLGEARGGRIRPGAPADFFGVEGDPASDIGALRAITLIVRGGELLDRDRLLRLARRAAEPMPRSR